MVCFRERALSNRIISSRAGYYATGVMEELEKGEIENPAVDQELGRRHRMVDIRPHVSDGSLSFTTAMEHCARCWIVCFHCSRLILRSSLPLTLDPWVICTCNESRFHVNLQIGSQQWPFTQWFITWWPVPALVRTELDERQGWWWIGTPSGIVLVLAYT